MDPTPFLDFFEAQQITRRRMATNVSQNNLHVISDNNHQPNSNKRRRPEPADSESDEDM